METCGEALNLYKWVSIILTGLLLLSEGLGLAKSVASNSVIALLRDIIVAWKVKK